MGNDKGNETGNETENEKENENKKGNESEKEKEKGMRKREREREREMQGDSKGGGWKLQKLIFLTFPWFKHILSKKWLKTREMLKMLKVFGPTDKKCA